MLLKCFVCHDMVQPMMGRLVRMPRFQGTPCPPLSIFVLFCQSDTTHNAETGLQVSIVLQVVIALSQSIHTVMHQLMRCSMSSMLHSHTLSHRHEELPSFDVSLLRERTAPANRVIRPAAKNERSLFKREGAAAAEQWLANCHIICLGTSLEGTCECCSWLLPAAQQEPVGKAVWIALLQQPGPAECNPSKDSHE
jgi:hypothetical protein